MHKGTTESVSRSVPIVLDNVDLQFFPEGGKLIADSMNRVAFKAIDEFGKPVDLKGTIFNNAQGVFEDIDYLIIAKSKSKSEKELEIKSKKSRFFQGMFMSSINVFPIPFQAYMTISYASLGWLAFDSTSITSYVAGATMGSFVMLYIYIFFFDKIKSQKFTSQKSMNRLIGIITAIIAIVTFINILRDL